MKKKLFISIVGVLMAFAVFNVCKAVAQATSLKLFEVESVSGVECSEYELSNKILGRTTQFCNVHKKNHESLKCEPYEKKCCDTRSETTKPDCWKD